jgi:hypothetical protein
MSKEKALDDIDRKEKDRKKLEFSQNKKYLEYIMNQKQEAVSINAKLFIIGTMDGQIMPRRNS